MITESLPTAKVSRRERERQRKIEDLLNAAGAVFAQKGFHGSSMEEIARAAEYATGALYRYFSSKEALYVALLVRRIRTMIDHVKASAAETKNPREALRTAICAQIASASSDTTLLQIYFGERLETAAAGEAWQVLEKLHLEYTEWMCATVRQGQKAKIFRTGPPELFIAAIHGMMMGLFRSWTSGQQDPGDSQSQADFLSEMALRGLSA